MDVSGPGYGDDCETGGLMFRPAIGSTVRDTLDQQFTIVRNGLPADCNHDHTWLWLGASCTLETKKEGACQGYYQCTKCNMVVSRFVGFIDAPYPSPVDDEQLVNDGVVKCRAASGKERHYSIYLPDEDCDGTCNHTFEFMMLHEETKSHTLEAFYRCTQCGTIWIQTICKIHLPR
jgi:hypothetical protein